LVPLGGAKTLAYLHSKIGYFHKNKINSRVQFRLSFTEFSQFTSMCCTVPLNEMAPPGRIKRLDIANTATTGISSSSFRYVYRYFCHVYYSDLMRKLMRKSSRCETKNQTNLNL
jgi:hypothetical protein